MTDTLILVPTELEQAQLRPQIEARPNVTWAVCGFGPVAAAATTQYWISHCRPQRTVLVGIAGSLSASLPPGNAVTFKRVAIEGIGAWQDDKLLAPQELGFAQYTGQLDGRHLTIQDHLSVIPAGSVSDNDLLLTVCAASGSLDQARERAASFPGAIAEDMEGFSVAVACQLANCPLTIIRGLSNVAGVRDKSQWQIGPALTAAARMLDHWLAAPDQAGPG